LDPPGYTVIRMKVNGSGARIVPPLEIQQLLLDDPIAFHFAV
jgi:hypothetical protein